MSRYKWERCKHWLPWMNSHCAEGQNMNKNTPVVFGSSDVAASLLFANDGRRGS